MQAWEDILNQAIERIQSVTDLKTLDEYRVHYLGKKSQLTDLLKSVGQLAPAERPILGQKVNAAKETLRVLIEERAKALEEAAIALKLQSEKIDITLPGRTKGLGSLHPISQTFEILKRIFSSMGFVCMEGPEIEDDFHNFAALNIPPSHPSRSMQDTFYFANQLLLRTHMSTVQIRTMEKVKPPLRMIAMGRVYRHEFDLTHTPMFHQMEALLIDSEANFASLKGLLTYFLEAFFYPGIAIRFRPSYFPFTEPSAEIDIACLKCEGRGCRICKHTGWLEVLGAGMVHPHVLTGVGIDAKHYRGFALGVGIDRLAMLKYGITDLRALFENDVRFLRQF